jgi:hypothetical protein
MPTRSEISLMSEGSGSSLAAITCGMPEPRPSGVNRRVAIAIAITPSGVTTSGSQRIDAT